MCSGVVILGLVLALVLTQEVQDNGPQHLIHVRLAHPVSHYSHHICRPRFLTSPEGYGERYCTKTHVWSEYWNFTKNKVKTSQLMFSFISFRRNINYLLPRLLNIRKPDILPRIINCYDVHAHMPQHQYSASYVYIITVYISLYNILKDNISDLTTYTCVTASTDLSAFSLFD